MAKKNDGRSGKIRNWSGFVDHRPVETFPACCEKIRSHSAMHAYLERLRRGKDLLNPDGSVCEDVKRQVMGIKKHLSTNCAVCQEYIDDQQARDYPDLD